MSTATTATQKSADVESVILPRIKNRWSPRTFQDRNVDQPVIDQLLEAARWAASSFNQQPWRFIYAHKGSEAYDKILNCLSDFNKKWASNAPMLLLTAYKEKFDNGKDNFHALHDLGLAMGNLTLQAQSLGIALHQMAGVDWKKAQKEFEVPEGYHVTTAVAMGYYGGDLDNLPEDLQKQETGKRKRQAVEEFAAEGEWPAEKD